ncbi:MAG: DHHW family protein [Eubacteriales bacterium]|nr:DHHW family protein [Eubacteriales bacterium]
MTKFLILILALLMIFISCAADVQTSAETEPGIVAETAVSETETQTEAVTEPETEPVTEPETEPVTEPETEPVTESETEPETEPAPVEVTSIALNASTFELDIGYAVYLKAAVSPPGAADKSVVWSSSDAETAAVDNSGKVTAKKEGSATVTAKSSNGIAAQCEITVKSRVVSVERINLDSSLTLTTGESFTFAPSVSPAGATDKRITLVSDNQAVAAVSGFTVTAVSAGTARITAKANDRFGAQAVCTVTVASPETKAPETAKPETPAYDEENNLSLPRTNKPYLAAQSIIRNGVICVSGSCEEGSVITVSGSLIKEFTVIPQEKRFFFSVSLTRGQSDTITVTAKVNGKRTSEGTQMAVEYAKGKVDVVVGKLSQLHYPMTLNDYYGTNLFNDSQLDAINKLVDRRLSKVREKSGVDTKLIYLIAPNALTIYLESARDEWTQRKRSDDSRRQQFIRLMNERNDPDTIVIDVVDYMLQNKDKGKLFYQTDTHWNTLGAYFGYYKMMQAIAVDFPDAAPYELDKFDVKAISQEGGDLVRFLNINTALGSETTYSCTLKGRSLAKVVSEDGVLPSSTLITSTVDNPKLPTAVVMRDSFGYSIQKFLFEHFEKMTYTPQSCGLDTAMTYVADAKPDYFIHILIERYIDQLLGG